MGERLGKRFTVTWEVVPPLGGRGDAEVAAVGDIAQRVDAVNVSDGALANLRTGPAPLAARIQDEAHVETIVHVTTRDRNTLALQADLLGAHLLGIRNLLALTGDPAKTGDHPRAKDVFEIWGSDLIRLVKGLNQGRTQAGGRLDEPTDFTVGTALDLAADGPKAREILAQKEAARPDFYQTQAVFDASIVIRYLSQRRVAAPILLGIVPPKDVRSLRRLGRIPGVSIPAAVQDPLESAADFTAAATDWLEGLVRSVAPFVHGVHIMPVTQNNPVALSLLDRLKDLRGQPTEPRTHELTLTE